MLVVVVIPAMKCSLLKCAKRTLAEMLKALKKAGAHPDMILATDPQKAAENGAALVALEEVLQRREGHASDGSAPTLISGAREEQDAPQMIGFWLKGAEGRAAGSTRFRRIECCLQPRSSDAVFKRDLQKLFASAGVDDDFDLPSAMPTHDFASLLRRTDERRNEHVAEVMTVQARAQRAVSALRGFGVMLMVEQKGTVLLVTVPEDPQRPGSPAMEGDSEPRDDLARFLDERNLHLFDLLQACNGSSAERFTTCFEKLAQMYNLYRGSSLRTEIGLILSLNAPSPHISEDGCLVLPAAGLATWEEYVFGITQPQWQGMVAAQREWRSDTPSRLWERKGKLMRIADALHFHKVRLDTSCGSPLGWGDDFFARMLKDEAAIRATVARNSMKDDTLKTRGLITIAQDLGVTVVPAANGNPAREVPLQYRIDGDGAVFFSSTSTTPQILRALRDHRAEIVKRILSYGSAKATLDLMRMHLGLTFSIDPEWKRRDATQLSAHLGKFTETVRSAESDIRRCVMATRSHGIGLLVAVSDTFSCGGNGILQVPWDVGVDAMLRQLNQ